MNRNSLPSACLAAVILWGCNQDSRQELIILTAASLTDVAEALVTNFEQSHSAYRVRLGSGASSTIARQIAHGAPADVVISANMHWLDYLVEGGYVTSPEDLFIGNSLVVVGPRTVHKLDSIAQLRKIGNIAVADWSHVPAGAYAREALLCIGLWNDLEQNLTPTLDVRASLQAASSGASDAAIVYESDMRLITDMHILVRLDGPCAPTIQYGGAVIATTANPGASELLFSQFTDTSLADLWHSFGFLSQVP